MAPSIEQLGPELVQPGATLAVSQEGAKIINDPLCKRVGVRLRRGSPVTVQATDEEKTHLQIPGHPELTIGVPNSMDLFEDPSKA